MTRLNPPLYLASSLIQCWRCGENMPAVAIIAPNVPDSHGDACILSDTRSLPIAVLAFIQKRFPSFRRKHSKTTHSEYYANTCPNCGVLSGDFYLHAEPGAPFFPATEDEAAHLTIEEILINGPIEVEAGMGVGTADLILEYGQRRITE